MMLVVTEAVTNKNLDDIVLSVVDVMHMVNKKNKNTIWFSPHSGKFTVSDNKVGLYQIVCLPNSQNPCVEHVSLHYQSKHRYLKCQD